MPQKLPKEVQHLIDKITNDDYESVKSSTQIKLGKLYLWVYDAKHKSKLEVWDALPLVIFLGYNKGLIHGINIHYLPYLKRLQFMKYLQSKGLKIKYEDIKKAWNQAKIPTAYAYLSYRTYLPSHIKSNIRIIEDEEDQYQIVKNVLPDFKKKQMDQVYRDIEKQLKRQRKR